MLGDYNAKSWPQLAFASLFGLGPIVAIHNTFLRCLHALQKERHLDESQGVDEQELGLKLTAFKRI